MMSFIMISVIMMSVIMMCVIMMCVILMRVIMISVIMMSAAILSVITLISAECNAKRGHAEYHSAVSSNTQHRFAKCHYAECRGTTLPLKLTVLSLVKDS